MISDKRLKRTACFRIFSLCILALFISENVQSQFPEKLKNGLRYYLDSKDSARFITLNMTSQVWIRNTQNNPGTTVQNLSESNTNDLSIRRIRFVLSGSLTDRVNIFIQFGQNNLNYLSSRKAGAFFHDVTADYAFIKKKFSVGAGLNGWNGPSRFSNSSVSSILVLDPPNYQEVTNDTYDQFVRRLGVYAKGKLGKFDYRISVAKPFVIQTASGSGTESLNANSPLQSIYPVFSTLPPKLVYQGYFMWQFLDQENNLSPAFAGSYLGRKKVLNLGAGFYYQQRGMFHYGSALKDTVNQDIRLFALDVFYDVPVNREKGTAFSLYSCLSNYFYGSNFIKVTGPDNPATGSRNISPTPGNVNFTKSNYGNAFPYLGTGNLFYLQSAFKLKDKLFGDQGTLQPFADIQFCKYDRLKDAMYVFDVGVNWLIYGNNSKITFNYQNRPFFSGTASGDLVQNSRLGEFVIQYQVAF